MRILFKDPIERDSGALPGLIHQTLKGLPSRILNKVEGDEEVEESGKERCFLPASHEHLRKITLKIATNSLYDQS